MDQTLLQKMPYPSEYDQPYASSWVLMMDHLDKMSSSYHEVSSFTLIDGDTIQVVDTPGNKAGFQEGRALRFRVGTATPWRYGVIREVFWGGGFGQVSFYSGHVLRPEHEELQLGGVNMTVHETIHIPLPMFGAPSSLLRLGLYERFTWQHEDARLCAVGYTQGTIDSGATKTITWLATVEPGITSLKRISEDMVYDQAVPNVKYARALPNNRIKAHNQLEVYLQTQGSNGDAENITVHIIAALEGNYEEAPCVVRDKYNEPGAGPVPQVELTISGLPPGGDWLGLGNGVHEVCPDVYETAQYWMWDPFFTGWTYPELRHAWEAIEFGSKGEAMHMLAEFIRDPLLPSAVAVSFVGFAAFPYIPSSGWTNTWSGDPATGTMRGFIQDSQFRTFSLGGVTFTFSRVDGYWSEGVVD